MEGRIIKEWREDGKWMVEGWKEDGRRMEGERRG